LLNQCDINYRQSGNKRLLVELTLIQVAQVTQPDTDTPGSGPRPRRLKILFQLLTASSTSEKTARQVAASVERQMAAPENRPSTNETIRPTLKMGSLGHSWNQLKKQAETPKNAPLVTVPLTKASETPEHEQEEPTDKPFTQNELERQWLSMCNRMPQHLVGIATRMKNMTPRITQMPQVEVEVPNQLVQAEIEQIRGSIAATLRRDLHNQQITLNIRVAEQKPEKRILTRRELFEQMSQQNPAIEKLRELFDLQLA
jgi:DNA polymerase-3 subunit gamma/tau